jgi:recombination protein RecT
MSTLKEFNVMLRDTRTQGYLADVLGEKKGEFVSNLTALVSNDRNLQACEPQTLMYAALTATALNLPLDKNLGMAYVIPFKNGKAGNTEAQFQMGWKGLVTLAQRSGVVRTLNADVVYEGELKSFSKLTGDVDITGEKKSDKVIGYFAYVKLINGFEKTVYMTVEEAEKHGKRYSQTYRSTNQYTRNSSKWTTDFDAMALKTCVKQLINKWVPKDTQMQMAVAADQSVQRDGSGTYHYVDNEREEAKKSLAEVAAAAVTDVVDEEDDEEEGGELWEPQKSKNETDTTTLFTEEK